MRTVYGLIVSVATILLVESAHYLAPTGGSSFIQVRVT